MIQKSKVAVITPLFNREHLIAETIESVIKQSYNNWELIIVDDGSNDKGPNIVNKYSKQDKRVTLLYRENLPKGPSQCRNIGAKYTKAKFLIFLDSDDLLQPFCLEQRVKFMEEHVDYDFAVFGMEVFKESPKNPIKLFNLFYNDKTKYLESFLKLDTPWGTPCPIWEKNFFLSCGGFNKLFLVKTDPELHTRVLLNYNPSYAVVKELPPDILYRTNHDQVKMEYFNSASLEYRIKYIESVVSWISEKNNSVGLYESLNKGTIIFFKNYAIRNFNEFQDKINNFRKFCRKNGILSKKNNILLTMIFFLIKNRNLVVSKLRLIGVLYRFLR